jgi:hypothetical protein
MIAIDETLFKALRCLQDDEKYRLIWVDFICINQADLNERAAQVRIMHDIYNGANEVHAYLGPEADGSGELPDFILLILSAKLNDRLQGRWDDPTSQYIPFSDSLPPIEDERWEAFRKFLKRRWFTRVWIIQEAVSARRLFLMCGGWTINSARFFAVIDIGYKHNLPFLPQWDEAVRPWENTITVGLRQMLFMRELGVLKDGSLGITFHRQGDNRKQGERVELWNQHEIYPNWQPSLLDILERSRHSQSTDPRDRIFAFLKLCQERDAEELRPDYRETVGDTYTRVAKFLIRAGQGGKLICNAGLSDSKLGLPSWIPDWSLNSLPFENIAPEGSSLPRNDAPQAGGGESGISLDSHNSLKTSAFIIDKVNSLGKIHQYRKDPPEIDFFIVRSTSRPVPQGDLNRRADNQVRNQHAQAVSNIDTGLQELSTTNSSLSIEDDTANREEHHAQENLSASTTPGCPSEAATPPSLPANEQSPDAAASTSRIHNPDH